MANIDDAFRVEKLSLNDNILMVEGLIDPSIIGYSAPTGSLYLSTLDTGGLYRKHGAADTDWVRFADIDANGAFSILNEPTGFHSRSTSSIDFSDNNRTFSISPTSPSTFFVYYIKGHPYIINNTTSVSIPNVTGTYYFYLDDDKQLHYTTEFTNSLIIDLVIVGIVYWNATQSTTICFADERHGTIMDGATHLYLHTQLGAKYESGLQLNGFTPEVETDAAVQIQVQPGFIRDEDIQHAIVDSGDKINEFDLEQVLSKPAQIPVLYRLGSSGDWYIKQPTNFPFIHTGTAGYTGTHIPFNEWTGTVWQLTEMDSNRIGVIHFFATNNINYPIIAVQGIRQYQNKPYGFELGEQELKSLTGLPFAEFVAIGSIIFSTSSSYSNTYKIRYEFTSQQTNYIDWREIDIVTVSNLGIMEHDSLTGLTQDDHTQYALAGVGSTRTFNIGDLYDVDVSSNSNNYILLYNDTTDTWTSQALSSSNITTALGYTPVNVAGSQLTGPLSLSNEPGDGLLVDNQHPWIDIIGDISPKLSNANSPSYNTFIGNTGNWSYDTNDYNFVLFNLPHDYVPATDVYLHIHWGHNGTAISGSFQITFEVTYAKRSNPATSFSSPITNTMVISNIDINNAVQYCHRVDEIQLSTIGGSLSQLNTSLLEVDGIINMKYTVDSIPTITGSSSVNTPFIFGIDLHIRSNGIGTKNSSPNYYT